MRRAAVVLVAGVALAGCSSATRASSSASTAPVSATTLVGAPAGPAGLSAAEAKSWACQYETNLIVWVTGGPDPAAAAQGVFDARQVAAFGAAAGGRLAQDAAGQLAAAEGSSWTPPSLLNRSSAYNAMVADCP